MPCPAVAQRKANFQDAMQSFDERGAGRRVAAELAAEDDTHDAYIEDDYADPTGTDVGDGDAGGDAFTSPAGWSALAHQLHANPFSAHVMLHFRVRPAGATRKQYEPPEEEEVPKRYKWAEIPEVTLPVENDTLFVRRAPPGACLQRKTKKIVDQFTSKEEVFELQVRRLANSGHPARG